MGRRGQANAARKHAGFRCDRHELVHRLRLWLPSTPLAIGQAVAKVRRLAARSGLDAEVLTDLEIALREALANAIAHGNAGDRGRRVFVRCYAGPRVGVLVAVRDQGQGFDPHRVPDPRQADRLQLAHGRGLLLMRELMDRVEYRRGGTEVVLLRTVR